MIVYTKILGLSKTRFIGRFRDTATGRYVAKSEVYRLRGEGKLVGPEFQRTVSGTPVFIYRRTE